MHAYVYRRRADTNENATTNTDSFEFACNTKCTTIVENFNCHTFLCSAFFWLFSVDTIWSNRSHFFSQNLVHFTERFWQMDGRKQKHRIQFYLELRERVSEWACVLHELKMSPKKENETVVNAHIDRISLNPWSWLVCICPT